MSSVHELDLGPLTWVKGEIDLALERATGALNEARSASDRLSRIKFAQTHLHQAHGALSIVGLDGLTQFSEMLDQLLGDLASERVPCTPELVDLTIRGVAAVSNYLDELARGQPDQALRLLDLYTKLVQARGLGPDLAGPADLFFPDLASRPNFAHPPQLMEDPKYLRTQRSRFERGLLKWFKNNQDPAGPGEMRDAVAGIEIVQTNPSSRAFWFASTAFFDAMSLHGFPVDPGTKRLCGRIDAQMRRLLEGNLAVADRLMREVLYHVAISSTRSQVIDAVSQAYQLERLIPAAGHELSDKPLAPVLRKLREGLSDAKEAWTQYTGGQSIGLPRFQEIIEPLVSQAKGIGQPELVELLQNLARCAQWLRQDPKRLSESLSLDLATAMLLLDSRLDAHGQAAPSIDNQIRTLIDRLKAYQRGEQLPALDLQQSESQTLELNRHLAKEILTSLGSIEQSLDNFFRSPSHSDELTKVKAPLKQIEGALSVMNEDDAVELIQDVERQLAQLAAQGKTAPAEFENIAHKLSALGVYVESLQHGHANLDRILHPEKYAPKPEPEVEAVPVPVAAPVAPAQDAPTLSDLSFLDSVGSAPSDNQDVQDIQASHAATVLNADFLRQADGDAPELPTLDELTPPPAKAQELDIPTLDFGMPAPVAAPAPAPTPVVQAPAPAPVAAPQPGSTGDAQIDAELLEIFIEEAFEVRETIRTHLDLLHKAPTDKDTLTTIRRSYHTLKGSGRMVGLKDFGDAAWGLEQTLNHWLRQEQPANAALLSLLEHAYTEFSAWIDQLHAGQGLQREVSALLAEAAALRGEAPPAAAPAPAPAPVAAAPVVEPPAAPALPAAGLDSLEFPDLSFTNLSPELLKTDAAAPLELDSLAPTQVAPLDLDALAIPDAQLEEEAFAGATATMLASDFALLSEDAPELDEAPAEPPHAQEAPAELDNSFSLTGLPDTTHVPDAEVLDLELDLGEDASPAPSARHTELALEDEDSSAMAATQIATPFHMLSGDVDLELDLELETAPTVPDLSPTLDVSSPASASQEPQGLNADDIEINLLDQGEALADTVHVPSEALVELSLEAEEALPIAAEEASLAEIENLEAAPVAHLETTVFPPETSADTALQECAPSAPSAPSLAEQTEQPIEALPVSDTLHFSSTEAENAFPVEQEISLESLEPEEALPLAEVAEEMPLALEPTPLEPADLAEAAAFLQEETVEPSLPPELLAALGEDMAPECISFVEAPLDADTPAPEIQLADLNDQAPQEEVITLADLASEEALPAEDIQPVALNMPEPEPEPVLMADAAPVETPVEVPLETVALEEIHAPLVEALNAPESFEVLEGMVPEAEASPAPLELPLETIEAVEAFEAFEALEAVAAPEPAEMQAPALEQPLAPASALAPEPTPEIDLEAQPVEPIAITPESDAPDLLAEGWTPLEEAPLAFTEAPEPEAFSPETLATAEALELQELPGAPETVIAEDAPAEEYTLEAPMQPEQVEAPGFQLAEPDLDLDDAPDALQPQAPDMAVEPYVEPVPTLAAPTEALPEPTLEPVLEPVLAEDEEPIASLDDDRELQIGSVTLSRPLYELYMHEARQHMATLRQEMGRFGNNPEHTPSFDAMRAAHTLAGISGTARFQPPQQLAKALEMALERLSDHKQAPTPAQNIVLASTISALDNMVGSLARHELPEGEPHLILQLEAITGLPELPPAIPALPAFTPPPAPAAAEEAETPQLRDELDPDLLPIFMDEGSELLDSLDTTLRAWRGAPEDPAHHAAVARLLHTLKGSARMVGAMNLGQYIHDLESRLDKGRDPDVTGILEDLQNGLDYTRSCLDCFMDSSLPMPPRPAFGGAAAQVQAAPAEVAAPAPAAAVAPVAAAPATESPAQAPAAELPAAQARAQLRVDAGRLDQFVNDAGEISIARTRIEGELRTLRRSLLDLTENVIRLRNQLREVEIQADSQMQSRLSQVESHHTDFDPLEMDRYTRLQELTRMMAESVGDVTTVQQNLLRNLDGAEAALQSQARMARELQQSLMRVRMVPFDSLSERLYRLVRQASKELGRRANLDVVGGQTEIDRSVLEAMVGPLGHLARNAIAHGIELPEARRAAGKSEIGQITVRVAYEGNEVLIEFRDDGAGLNFDKIRNQAINNGLIDPHEQLDRKQLTNLIFVPGFTTARLSSLAGRGVGMDVVKSETAAVGGRITVDSEPGKGSVFSIHLPLTLAVTQTLLVRSGGKTFAIPSSMVAQVQELKPAAMEKAQADKGVEWLGDFYSYRYLPNLLGDTDAKPELERFNWLLLLRAGSETLALHVDALQGNQEVVVKNAGPQYARMVGFAGATVLGDGEIILILNPVALAGRAITWFEGRPAVSAPVLPQTQPLVMVVDDSLTVRKITTRLLEREGFKVVTAKDGVDALEQLQTVRPDVIIADIEMPRMDGFDLTRNIRA
ncbi:MAG: Hpt domain-containing protein, partial [Rhodocyclales bacterium]|nr:Hpt domain-containing protein [Rhodocyclales bacterium]